MKSKIRKLKFKLKSLKFNSKYLFIFIVLFIGIGFSALSTELGLFGKINLKNDGINVVFQNLEIDSNSVDAITPATIVSKNKVTASVKLNNANDSYTFNFDISNKGKLDTELDSINITPTLSDEEKEYLEYEVTYYGGEEIELKDNIDKDKYLTAKVTLKLKEGVTIPTDGVTVNPIIELKYKKKTDDSNNIIPYPMFLNNDKYSKGYSSDGLNFYYGAGAEGYGYDNKNGESGVFLYKENNQDIYYYRGAITNNNVVFNNICWLIVRTTSTGGTKLIYNGKYTEDNSCNNIGVSKDLGYYSLNGDINENNSPADVGYKYGKRYMSSTVNISKTGTVETLYGNDVEWDGKKYILKDTVSISGRDVNSNTNVILGNKHYTCLNDTGECNEVYYIYYSTGYELTYLTFTEGITYDKAVEDMYTNEEDSIVKIKIEEWYNSNLISYTSFFEDIEFCNDRELSQGALKSLNCHSDNEHYYNYISSFEPYNRLFFANINATPSLDCAVDKNKFSVSNKELSYPVALLTADEAALAGQGSYVTQNTNYLYSRRYWWTMSPAYIDKERNKYVFTGNNMLYITVTNRSAGVRPSLSLKS